MRVLIADDHEIVLDSLSMLLNSIEGIEVIGVVNDGKKALAFLEKNIVDVVLSDMNMPQMNGIDLTLQIRQRFPDVKVLMLTVSEDVAVIRAAFQAGVSGYVMKKAGKADLQKALKTVENGQKYFSDSVIFELMNPDLPKFKEEILQQTVSLTDREIEIIKLISQEHSTIEIAEKLFISQGTVETHRHNILRKLNLKNSIGVIKYALKHGLI